MYYNTWNIYHCIKQNLDYHKNYEKIYQLSPAKSLLTNGTPVIKISSYLNPIIN